MLVPDFAFCCREGIEETDGIIKHVLTRKPYECDTKMDRPYDRFLSAYQWPFTI